MLNPKIEKVNLIVDSHCSPYGTFFNGLFMLNLDQYRDLKRNKAWQRFNVLGILNVKYAIEKECYRY